jgi:hypothetical protein
MCESFTRERNIFSQARLQKQTVLSGKTRWVDFAVSISPPMGYVVQKMWFDRIYSERQKYGINSLKIKQNVFQKNLWTG